MPMSGRRTQWASIGTTVVSYQWVGVPDKYAPPRIFVTYDEASAYADETSGQVEFEYLLRSPDGVQWPVRVLSVPERYRGDAAIGSVVIDRRYEVGSFGVRDRPSFSTPQEAEAFAERQAIRQIQERLSFQAPDGARFDINGTLIY